MTKLDAGEISDNPPYYLCFSSSLLGNTSTIHHEGYVIQPVMVGDTSKHAYEVDADLVSRALAGDQMAFRALFDSYSPRIYHLAVRMLGNTDDAADATQEIFVRAFKRLHTLKHGQAFSAWIMRMAINLLHDQLRKKRHVTCSLDESYDDSSHGKREITDYSPGQEERYLSAELSQQIQRALLSLPEEHRTVVILHHLEELGVEEIAAILQIPAGTVKSRLARARATLRMKLAGYLEE